MYKGSSSLLQLYIDNKLVTVPSSFTVMQACLDAGVDIPRFCYNERLSIVVHVVCV